MIIINQEEYRDKVLACWLGKNIGGTLGAPFEWKRGIFDVDFYTQEHKGEPLPNDDLDIQLLWLIALEAHGPGLDTRTLAEYWNVGVTPHWAEYGLAKSNLRAGLQPPVSGTLNNPYRHSCGAYIRSEIWACIAPAMPDVAAWYAYQDAIIDHGNGEGTYGEVFIAALESAAFVVSDLRELIRIGLSYIPEECAVTQAVRLVERCYDQGTSWRDTRDEILRHFRGDVQPWNRPASSDDIAKGFNDGPLGFDVPSNVAITILGLLYGGEDFGKVLCTAVNCGEDTDCTAATAGSIYGIIRGCASIPAKWIEPIGRSIKTICLNTGDYNPQLAKSVDELTDRTVAVGQAVLAQSPHRNRVQLSSQPSQKEIDPAKLASSNPLSILSEGANGPIFSFDFFSVAVDYGTAPYVRDGESAELRIRISNNKPRFHANVLAKLYLPPGWKASHGAACIWPNYCETVVFKVQVGEVREVTERGVLELTIPGHPTVMLVPLIWVNGNSTPGPGA
ncbi:MAG: ADP-ribosylglycohydrolase family protein [Methylacidiphilales bacterium]|nr:ADP-ribosylglycohydrolase family protein [Candidatus Methylacidiphilales bacterium]